MKLDKHSIQEAMDNRLSSLNVSPTRRAAIWRAVQTENCSTRRGAALPRTALAVLAVALVLGGTALAFGSNLFGHFAALDSRFGVIEDSAVVENAAPLETETPELGKAAARIESAYYDGRSLVVAAALEQTVRTEPYIPSEEELSLMTPISEDYALNIPEAGNDTLSDYRKAVTEGVPCGYVTYTLYLGDHMTANGIDPGPPSGLSDRDEDGLCELREFSTLPEALQDQESLDLAIEVRGSAFYVYFDGETEYYRSDRVLTDTVTAVVNRTEAQSISYSGTGDLYGVPCTVTATVTPLYTEISIQAEEDLFAEDWLAVVLSENDEQHDLRVLEAYAATGRSAAPLDARHFSGQTVNADDGTESITVSAFPTADRGEYVLPHGEEVADLPVIVLTPTE